MKLIDLFEHITINESFKDAKNAFSGENSPEEVEKYLQKFRELSSANKISGPEKDINGWIKRGFDSFRQFVDNSSQNKSGREVKREIKDAGAKKVADFPKWVVIVPLSKEASCKYGAGTKWCTSANTDNKFDEYFHDDDITLFYVISKTSNEKYAIEYDRTEEMINTIYDAEDQQIPIEQFEHITGIDISNDILDWAGGTKEHTPSLDNKIERADPDAALNILKYESNKRDLSPEQSEALKKKIAQNPDALLEYCKWVSNSDDPWFKKTALILMNNMKKSAGRFKQLAGYLDEYVEILGKRSEAIEKNIGSVIQMYDGTKNQDIVSLLNNYWSKFNITDPSLKRSMIGQS